MCRNLVILLFIIVYSNFHWNSNKKGVLWSEATARAWIAQLWAHRLWVRPIFLQKFLDFGYANGCTLESSFRCDLALHYLQNGNSYQGYRLKRITNVILNRSILSGLFLGLYVKTYPL